MKSITVKIQSYGAIQKLLPQDLMLTFENEVLVADVLQDVLHDYPDCSLALEKCACAIGEDIISRHQLIDTDNTLVLLSPVAGG